jgi:hypothetical protein
MAVFFFSDDALEDAAEKLKLSTKSSLFSSSL